MKMSDANSQDLSTAMTVISANIEGSSFKSIHAINDVQERALSLFVSPKDSQSTTSCKAEDNWNDTHS